MGSNGNGAKYQQQKNKKYQHFYSKLTNYEKNDIVNHLPIQQFNSFNSNPTDAKKCISMFDSKIIDIVRLWSNFNLDIYCLYLKENTSSGQSGGIYVCIKIIC